jgi:hypothetical protein
MHGEVDIEDAAQVILAGKPWPVPLLAARQNKIIDPLILSLLPIFVQWQSDKAAALAQLGQTQYDALLEIAFVALKRAHPQLVREQFLDMPITLPELIAAFSIIAQQTGVFARGAPGEAEAGNAQTGTASSPMSAI